MRQLALLLGLLLGAQVARAQDDTDRCEIEIHPLSFGMLPDLERRDAHGEGMVVINCENPTSARISLGRGQSALAPPRRQLRGETGVIEYQIYLDGARSRIWGDGEAGTQDVLAPTGTPMTLHGHITVGQQVQPGAYQDVIEVQVEW